MGEEGNLKALAQLNRLHLAEVWQRFQNDADSLAGDDQILADLMEMHPDYAGFWENIEEFGDHFFDPRAEENPFLHVSLHMTVEKQMRSGAPQCVLETMQRLVARGDDPHEARHAIMRILVQRLLEVVTRKQPFDARRYANDLGNL